MSVLQPYYDIFKLIQKENIYSQTTSSIFKISPVIGLICVYMALFIMPFAGIPAIFSFKGDFILLAYLFGLSRFFTVVAALDTGSSFEGMGASREVTFSAITESVFFLSLIALILITKEYSLSGISPYSSEKHFSIILPVMLLVSVAIFLISLAENSRIPVDDPNTHLELTMIHEVMILDYSSADLAVIQYLSSIKMWIFFSIIANILLPHTFYVSLTNIFYFFIIIFSLAVLTGIIESSIARLRMLKVPQFIIGAACLSLIAVILAFK